MRVPLVSALLGRVEIPDLFIWVSEKLKIQPKKGLNAGQEDNFSDVRNGLPGDLELPI